MTERDTVYCEPCENKGKMKLANTWCSDCEEGFCNECVKVHKVTRILRHHHLIPITDHNTTIPFSINQSCDDHKKKICFFCSQHDQVLCLKCVQLHHSGCDVQELAMAGKGIKSSTALSDLEDGIHDMLKNVKIGIERLNEFARSLNEQEQMIIRKIKDMREKINSHLDKLQEELLVELKTCKQKQQLHLADFRNRLSRKESSLREFKEHMLLMKTVASDTQAFIGIKKLDKSIFEDKETIKDTMTNLARCEIALQINSKLESFFTDVKMFGEVIVETIYDNKHYIEPKGKQAQKSVAPQSENFQLQLRQNIVVRKIGYTCNDQMLTSCVILPNKKLMFADSNNKILLIHNEGGLFEHFINLSEQSFDITVRSKDTVFVTYRRPNTYIDSININTYEVKKIAFDPADKSCWGISHDDSGKLYVLAYPDGIKKIDPNKKIAQTIPVDVLNVYNITIHKSKIYYTNKANHTVYCCDLSGNRLWSFSHGKLSCSSKSSNALTSDNQGNIYVAGPSENIVMLISNDGKRHQIILDKSDKLDNPRGLFYDKNTKRLLVCNQENGHAALYDVPEQM